MKKTSNFLFLSKKFLKFSFQNEAKTTSPQGYKGVKTKFDQCECDKEAFDVKSRLANSFKLSTQNTKHSARDTKKTPQLKYKSLICNLNQKFPTLVKSVKKFPLASFPRFSQYPLTIVRTYNIKNVEVKKDRSFSLKWRLLAFNFFKQLKT